MFVENARKMWSAFVLLLTWPSYRLVSCRSLFILSLIVDWQHSLNIITVADCCRLFADFADQLPSVADTSPIIATKSPIVADEWPTVADSCQLLSVNHLLLSINYI